MPFRLALPYAWLHGPAAPKVTVWVLAPAHAVSARRKTDLVETNIVRRDGGQRPERHRPGTSKTTHSTTV